MALGVDIGIRRDEPEHLFLIPMFNCLDQRGVAQRWLETSRYEGWLRSVDWDFSIFSIFRVGVRNVPRTLLLQGLVSWVRKSS